MRQIGKIKSAKKIARLFGLVLFLLALSSSKVSADVLTSQPNCAIRIPASKVLGVKYKPENRHGDRGPSWLVQNAYLRVGKRKIEIRDTKCKLISSFGLYATDFPYGARYYQRSVGGAKHTAPQLYAMAKKAGSSMILIESTKGSWITVKDPRIAEGTVYSE